MSGEDNNFGQGNISVGNSLNSNSNVGVSNAEINYAGFNIGGIDKKKRSIIVLVLIIFVLIIVGIIIAVSQSGKINAKDYIADDIVADGYNGYGTVSVNNAFDYESLVNDLGRGYYESLYSDPLEDAVNIYFDKNEGLSNGDTVTITISINYDYINSYHFTKELKGKDVYTETYKISNLPDPIEINPFDALSGVVVDKTTGDDFIEVKSDYTQNINGFSISCGDNRFIITDSEGDSVAKISFSCQADNFDATNKVTVNASCDGDSYARDGIIINPVSSEYTPITCDYITKGDDISSSDFNTLKDRAVSDFKNQYPDAKYEKAYFGYDKAGNGNAGLWNSGYYNEIKYLFSRKEDGKKVYCCVSYYNVKIRSDGKIVDVDSISGTTGSSAESVKELETDQAENWDVFSTLSVNN